MLYSHATDVSECTEQVGVNTVQKTCKLYTLTVSAPDVVSESTRAMSS